MGDRRAGVLLALTAVLFWGTQFPVAKSLFRTIDAYTLTALRLGGAALLLLAVLAAVEGRAGLRYDGRRGRATVAGMGGYVAGVLVIYVGLQSTTATSAAVIVAMQPLLMALVLRVSAGARLSRVTACCTALAFAGTLLVVTRGDPGSVLAGSLGWGALLVAAGQVGWVLYTIDSISFTGWSSLRYTTLTALPAAVVVVVVAIVVAAVGVTAPAAGGLVAAPGLLVYSIVGPIVIAVIAWNAGRARLGAQAIALFPNLVPVVTFTIEIARGYDVQALEVAGAALTIGALTVSTLVDARAARRSVAEAVARSRVGAPEPI